MIWAILFVIQVLAMVVLAIWLGNKAAHAETENGDSGSFKVGPKAWTLIALSMASGAVLSLIWLFIIKTWAEAVIWFTLLFSCGIIAANALIAFAIGEAILGVFMLIMLALNLLYVYLVRWRIPFAAAMLKVVVECMQLFPAMGWVAFCGILVHIVWAVIWAFGAAGVWWQLDQSNIQDGRRSAAYFFLILSFYWTAQVINGVVHTTIAGTFATWYFMYPAAMPANPTVASFKRAAWTSFGSICLGSLIVAIIKTLKRMAESGRRARNGFVRACVICILGCLEQMIQYFNHYAFTEIAIYGKPFCEAAKDTWQLFVSRGFDLLINDNLIGGVLQMGALIVGFLTFGIVTIVAKLIFHLNWWWFWAIIGLVIGVAIAFCAMEVVDSCVSACFVCFAEDPEALRVTKPNTYAALSGAINQRQQELRVVQQQQDREDQA